MSSPFFTNRGGGPWLRLGRLEVTTTMAVVLATVASWLVWVVVPAISGLFAFSTNALLAGGLWRLFTWPLAEGLSLGSVLNLVVFWYFGTELERQIGRERMAWFLLGVWASLTVSSLLVGLLFRGDVLAGLGLIEFVVLLVWVAEYPRRPLFFGIQAWVVGTVLLALQVLLLVAGRAWASLLALMISLALAAIAARRFGLLGDHGWIPGRRARSSAPRAYRPDVREQQRRAADRERLDQLLDRINVSGIGSLTTAERAELMKLRERLRGR